MERLQNQWYIFELRKFDHISGYRNKLNWPSIRQRSNINTVKKKSKKKNARFCVVYNVLFNPAAPEYLRERFDLRTSMECSLRSSEKGALVIPAYCSDIHIRAICRICHRKVVNIVSL